MNEIEYLYNLVGIKPLHSIPDEEGFFKLKNIEEDFTAEKQLELIKLIAKSQVGGVCIEVNVKGTVTISARQDFLRYFEFQEFGSSLPQALAKLVINIWRDLSDINREDIKEILRR